MTNSNDNNNNKTMLTEKNDANNNKISILEQLIYVRHLVDI